MFTVYMENQWFMSHFPGNLKKYTPWCTQISFLNVFEQ